MGGDYTSWGGATKAKPGNSTEPQAEVEHYRGWLRESAPFAGGLVLLATKLP
jgi:hypothetical protein